VLPKRVGTAGYIRSRVEALGRSPGGPGARSPRYAGRIPAAHRATTNQTASTFPPEASREGCTLFQHFNLFSHMTVLQNVVEAPVHVKREARSAAVGRARRLLDRVGLAGKDDRYPAELSGGEQQRVAICRALAMEPILLLFNEPTSALDPELAGEVLDVMRNLASEGMTMLVVTHEMSFARDVANRIVFMDHGAIVEQGNAREVLANPQQDRTRTFLSRVS
jgi:polar amino acid transport system ATP-binding protein